ncbi:MAG: hypothetical protein QGG42_13900 [Phycisphaerae bacterium]|jgi:hypothetical protein|nr:hypothetical protein [Phycisphaerae bacterium]
MTGQNIIVMTAVSVLAALLLVLCGCDKPPSPNTTTLDPTPKGALLLGAENPRALLERMYFAVENNKPASFHACHKLQGMERALMESRFDYLVAQANLRRAAVAVYGERATATLKGVKGGIIFFDTSRFLKAPIERNGDSARVTWTDRESERQTTTYNATLKRTDGRWFLVSSAEKPLDAEAREWCRTNIRFVQVATLQLRTIVGDVRSGAIRADELDERVEDALRSSGR